MPSTTTPLLELLPLATTQIVANQPHVLPNDMVTAIFITLIQSTEQTYYMV